MPAPTLYLALPFAACPLETEIDSYTFPYLKMRHVVPVYPPHLSPSVPSDSG